MHSDVRTRLQDAVSDAHRGTGSYGYYIDHTGDGESGDCIYSCDGDTRSAPYEISNVGGKSVTHIDTESSKNVVPVTTYQEEADDDDQYATMDEAYKKAGLYTELPLYERFISKAERDSADEGDFAGKGKSYPILKPGDVQAAVHAMGRAGDKNVGMSTLKSRIIALAKKKGWGKYLPKSWQGDSSDTKESRVPRETGALKLVESFDWKEEALKLIESSGNPMRMKIKLIAPGKGSSAFYPAEVLKRDGPTVFTKGTHIYINHATNAEESARPEGDWHKLAGALDGNAYWDESAKAGPGLYGDALFTSDYAPLIKEKAAFTGMSIRASGVAESGKQKDGVPVLAKLTHAESVDVVTRAGAGGMILTEAARPGNQQEVEMTDAEVKALVESAVKSAVAAVLAPVKTLETRALKGDAIVAASKVLDPLALNEAAKGLVIDNVLRDLPVKEGELDTEKFVPLVSAEARRVAAAVGFDAGRVLGMGTGASLTEADEKRLRKDAKQMRKLEESSLKESEDVFSDLMGSDSAAKIAARGRAA